MDPLAERPGWMNRFDPDDFDRSSSSRYYEEGDEVRVPEWGVNPFMDAFECESFKVH